MSSRILILSLAVVGWGCSVPARVPLQVLPDASQLPNYALAPSVLVERFLAEAELLGEDAARNTLLPVLVSAPGEADAVLAAQLNTLPQGTSGRRLLLTALVRRNAVPSWVEISERVLCCVEEIRRGDTNPAAALIAFDRLRAMGIAADAPLRVLAAAGGPRGAVAESIGNHLLLARPLLGETP